MALFYEIALVSTNGGNTDLDLVNAATNSLPNGSTGDFSFPGSGDVNGDGTADAGDTFIINIGGTDYTATVTFIYDPNAASDSNLMVFTIDGYGTSGVEYAYNLGIDGETADTKVAGGWITNGHAHNGKQVADNPDDTVCFVAGTLIDTANGPVAIEDLSVGDSVLTVSSGAQDIKWIGCTTQRAEKGLTPIRIKAGALGENTPSADLLVSPAHRMVVSGWRAELLFGEREYLVPAKTMVNDDTITVAHDLDEVDYYHVMFDKHEIVMSNGAPSESFHPNQAAIGTLDQVAREELLKLFPQLEFEGKDSQSDSVRPMLTDAEASLLH